MTNFFKKCMALMLICGVCDATSGMEKIGGNKSCNNKNKEQKQQFKQNPIDILNNGLKLIQQGIEALNVQDKNSDEQDRIEYVYLNLIFSSSDIAIVDYFKMFDQKANIIKHNLLSKTFLCQIINYKNKDSNKNGIININNKQCFRLEKYEEFRKNLKNALYNTYKDDVRKSDFASLCTQGITPILVNEFSTLGVQSRLTNEESFLKLLEEAQKEPNQQQQKQ